MRRFLRAPAAVLLRAAAALLAPLFAAVARTGYGSGVCLRWGFVPVPVHFYQPVFDPKDVPAAVWQRRHDLPGVEFDVSAQLRFLADLAEFGSECSWPERLSPGERLRYHTQNGSFGFSSGALLHAAVRRFEPSRVIEIGSGMSSLIFDGALAMNEASSGTSATLTTIDPFPHPVHEVLDPERTVVVTKKVEDVALHELTSLQSGDMLFIDSSHAVRTGGDVTFLYLDVLPRLGAGVIVHVHDIQLPYEYPRGYPERESPPRVFWNEQYLLQAFLIHNPRMRILAAGYFLQRDHPEEFAAAFPAYDPGRHRLTSSIYLQTR